VKKIPVLPYLSRYPGALVPKVVLWWDFTHPLLPKNGKNIYKIRIYVSAIQKLLFPGFL